jgi:hypothetical protein
MGEEMRDYVVIETSSVPTYRGSFELSGSREKKICGRWWSGGKDDDLKFIISRL